MRLTQKIINFFRYLRSLFKLQPIIFITVVFSLIYGAVTVITGSIQLSYYIGVTGACALIFAVAKFYALTKYAAIETQENPANIEMIAAKNIAISASVMSFLHFGIAVVCTFFQEESPENYGLWFIFFAAGAAFVKIILSTVNAIRTKRSSSTIIHNIKLIDNANALIVLGLTQRAIIYYVGNETARWASGLGGMFFGLCALFVCLTMFMKYKYAITQEKKDT